MSDRVFEIVRDRLPVRGRLAVQDTLIRRAQAETVCPSVWECWQEGVILPTSLGNLCIKRTIVSSADDPLATQKCRQCFFFVLLKKRNPESLSAKKWLRDVACWGCSRCLWSVAVGSSGPQNHESPSACNIFSLGLPRFLISWLLTWDLFVPRASRRSRGNAWLRARFPPAKITY